MNNKTLFLSTLQGVNLSNIVTSTSDEEHAVLVAIQQLSKIDINEEDSIIKMCVTVKSECDKGLAEKVLATKNNAYEILINIAHKCENPVVLKDVMAALASLLDMNPDPYDSKGFEIVVYILRNQTDAGVIRSVLDMTLSVCVRHEQNRQNLVHNKILVSHFIRNCENFLLM